MIESIDLRDLTESDVDAAYALFDQHFPALARGIFYSKTHDDYARVITHCPGGNVGAFIGDRLVGFTLSDFIRLTQLPDPFALRREIALGDQVALAYGTLVHPDYQCKMLGPRLIRARRASLDANGVRHAIGAMIITNLVSVGMYFRNGAIICGFEHDKYDLLNFSHYSGVLCDRPVGPTRVETACLDEMRALFDQGFVARKMTRDKASGQVTFHLTDDFAVA